MHFRRSTLLLLLCACLSGQPAARESRDLAVTRSSDSGTVTIHLHNDYSSAATAWILQCQVPQGGSRFHWTDQDLSFQTKPIEPGKEIEFAIRPMQAPMMQRAANPGSCEDFHVIAAVFADGTVSGDLQWIDAIVGDRRQAYQDLAKANEILSDAISKQTDAAGVIQQLTDWQKSARPEGMGGGKPSPTYGPTSGWRSNGTAPPVMRVSRSPVASAALWLVETQKESLPDAAKALADWRDRLARLPAVAESGEPSSRPLPMMRTGPFTPPTEVEMTGKPAPDFTLKDVDGHEFTLSSLRGKPVLLDFWATWCEPCREEMPHIKALYDQFKDKGLTVVCLDPNETADQARRYFEDNHYSFVNLLDTAGEANKNYNPGAIPRVVLIDKDGIVRYFHRGWGSGMDLTPEVRKLIE